MAFSAKGLGLMPGLGGKGGIASYHTADDNLATATGNAYWATDLTADDDRENLEARTALEDFIRRQRVADTFGVPLILVTSDENRLQWAVLSGAGRVTLSGDTKRVR